MSTWGKILKLSVFGQSRGQAVGMVLDGLPAGLPLDMPRLEEFMRRRAPGLAAWSSPRREDDQPMILSGLLNGLTCGAPLAAVIENTDARSDDDLLGRHSPHHACVNVQTFGALEPVTPYSDSRIPRPGHADFGAWARYGKEVDLRGGGHFSGRLTAPLCLAGGLCLQMLERLNIYVGAHIFAIDGVTDTPFDAVNLNKQQLLQPGSWAFAVNDQLAGAQMEARILAAKEAGDSVGGVVECAALGLPPGLGNPMFEGLENRLSGALFAIPGLKGIEFGAGFAAAAMHGSRHNDAFIPVNGQIRTATNNHGGVLGGISSGMPLIFRVAFKPTPSIAQEQHSIDLDSREPVKLQLQGRHDPCIAPRAVPCVEAITALVLLDMLLERDANCLCKEDGGRWS